MSNLFASNLVIQQPGDTSLPDILILSHPQHYILFVPEDHPIGRGDEIHGALAVLA
jgi:hypothetical protein